MFATLTRLTDWSAYNFLRSASGRNQGDAVHLMILNLAIFIRAIRA